MRAGRIGFQFGHHWPPASVSSIVLRFAYENYSNFVQ
jgi:hypothetical protein